MKKSLAYLVLLACALLVGMAHQAEAATYYVDFDGGSDANNGLSTTSSWKNIPGTRTANNSGWVAGNTGWKALVAGDTIMIKGGTTHNSSKGGYILIDSSWYANGTAAAPITIKLHTGWGTGQALIDGSGVTVPGWSGLVSIKARSYIVFDGSVDSGIKIQNSSYDGFNTTGNYTTLRNVEVYNSKWANVTYISPSYPTTYLTGGLVDNVIAHKTNTNDDWSANFFFTYVDQAIIQNSTAYDANTGSDGIHLGSCKNMWVLNCTVYNNGEQGIDISKDGDYKTRDDSYNITVRDCVGYNNFKQNFDSNSASRDIYFINNQAWRTTESESGDGNFQVYEAGNRVFFINNTSSASHDYGFGISWWGAYYNLAAGTYPIYIINSISSGDSGRSVYVEGDLSSRSFSLKAYNSIFNSGGSTIVTDKGTNYTATNINGNSGGWTGTGCKSVNPLFTASGSSWEATNLKPQSTSPALNAGAFPFTIASTGSGTVLTLNKLVADLDARMVFRPGDTLQIEGSGRYTVASVTGANTITLTSAANFTAGKGVWLPWPNARIDIGMLFPSATGNPNPPTQLRMVP